MLSRFPFDVSYKNVHVVNIYVDNDTTFIVLTSYWEG